MALEFGTITSLAGNHKREIRRLEALREVSVEVSKKVHKQRLTCKVRVPELGVEGEMLWSPPAASDGELKVEESTEVVVELQILQVVMSVQGELVRHWGTVPEDAMRICQA